jgi:hypothetical protein
VVARVEAALGCGQDSLPSPPESGARSLASRWPRASRLPQHRPVPGVLAGIFWALVVDPSLTVDRVHGDPCTLPRSFDGSVLHLAYVLLGSSPVTGDTCAWWFGWVLRALV